MFDHHIGLELVFSILKHASSLLPRLACQQDEGAEGTEGTARSLAFSNTPYDSTCRGILIDLNVIRKEHTKTLAYSVARRRCFSAAAA